jgi:hypothetical protein
LFNLKIENFKRYIKYNFSGSTSGDFTKDLTWDVKVKVGSISRVLLPSAGGALQIITATIIMAVLSRDSSRR